MADADPPEVVAEPQPEPDEAWGFTRLGEHLSPACEAVVENVANGAGTPNVLTGFADLDNFTDGFAPGDLIVLGGATSMGKTSLALGITAHNAVAKKRPVAYLALQETREQLVRKLLLSEARVMSPAFGAGPLDDESRNRLALAAGYLQSAPIYFQDGVWELASVLASMQQARDAHGVELIIVDPIQMVSVPSLHGLSRDQEVGHVARELKRFAIRERIAVLACSSLSRQPDTRYDKRPAITDLRDSGDIENTADQLLLLFRPEYYFGPCDKEGNSLEALAEINIQKHRSGATGRISLLWLKEFTRFEPYLHTERRVWA